MTSELEYPEETIETSQAAPVFLLCSPCSGSNLLGGLLAAHPQAYVTPGMDFLGQPTLADFFKNCQATGGNAHGILRAVAQLYTGEQSIGSIETARRWLGRRRQWPVTKVLEELCEKVAPRRLIDRSLHYSRDAGLLETLQDTLPHAMLVHLTRHPIGQGMAVMHSLEGVAGLWDMRSVDYNEKRPEVDPQHAWFDTQATIMEFGETLPETRYRVLRIEDVVAQPEETLGSLCAWLGLDFSPEILAGMLQSPEWVFSGTGPFNAIGGNEWDPLQRLNGALPVIPPMTLDESLPWRTKTSGLADPVKMLANALGY